MKLFFQITQNAQWFVAVLSILGSSYLVFDLYETLNRPSKSVFIEKGPDISKKEAKTVEKSKPLSHYEVIGRRNLFRYPNEEGKKPFKTEEKPVLPQTELRLALKGTIIGSPANTFAIIEELDKRKERLFQLHDKVKDAEIVKIQRERIVLRRAGREEMLLIFQEKKGRVSSRRGRVASPARGSRSRPPRSSEGSRTTKVLKREDVVRGTSSIQRLMTQLRIKPHFSSGNPDGFMVSHIQKGSLVERAGLMNGDVIKGINDIKIDSPSELLKAYRNLNDASLIDIEIERQGQKRNISIKVE